MPAVAPLRSVAPPKDLYGIGEIPPLGHVPEKMHAWVIRKERHGPPEQSFKLEVVPTWTIGEDEVLLLVMAGGVNYNGVWAGLGQPISHPRRAQAALSHRRLGRLGRGLGGRRQGASLEGRRRGHRPLQPGRRRRRGVQWRRSAAVAVAAHLGLRDPGRLVRAILPRAVAAIDGEAEASHLGRVGLLHADARYRLPHAVRPFAAHAQARRQRAGVGRLRRPRRVRHPARRRFGRQRHRRRLRRLPRPSMCSTSAPRASSTARSSSAGASSRR